MDNFNENDEAILNHDDALHLPSSTSLARRRNSPNLTLYIKKNASPKVSLSKRESGYSSRSNSSTSSPIQSLDRKRSIILSELDEENIDDGTANPAGVIFKKPKYFASKSIIERKISQKTSSDLTPPARIKKLSTDSTKMRMEDDLEKIKEIVRNKQITERLISRILPRDVFKQLSEGASVEPKPYENVTIYFSDIVGFTSLASEMNPLEVIIILVLYYHKP